MADDDYTPEPDWLDGYTGTQEAYDDHLAAIDQNNDRFRAPDQHCHDPLCFDKSGHPHDNECECWCHDEGSPGGGAS